MWHLDPCSHLAARDIGWKLDGGCAPLGEGLREGELGLRLTQCGQGWGLPACQVSSWSVQPFGHSARTSQTDRQRFDSIGRTVLQMVAQKLKYAYLCLQTVCSISRMLWLFTFTTLSRVVFLKCWEIPFKVEYIFSLTMPVLFRARAMCYIPLL